MAGLTNWILSFTFVLVLGDSREKKYDRVSLPQVTSHGFLYLVEGSTLVRCGVLCLSVPGCRSFSHDFGTCRILSGDVDLIGYVNISSMYVEPRVKDACTLAGYQPLLEGLFCVKLFPGLVSWHTANSTCANDGGSLIMLKTAEFDLKFNALSLFNGTRYWIGGSDLAVEGQFVWLDGTDVLIQSPAWFAPNPNNENGIEHCLEILGRYKLNDQRCSLPLAFMCEKIL